MILLHFSCDCTQAYTGKNCERKKDFCEEFGQPCKNNATCTSIDAGFVSFIVNANSLNYQSLDVPCDMIQLQTVVVFQPIKPLKPLKSLKLIGPIPLATYTYRKRSVNGFIVYVTLICVHLNANRLSPA